MKRAVHFPAHHEAAFVEIPEDDSPGPGEALVRTMRMGICGTDAAAFRGNFPFFEFPRIPGHELGVEVLEVGESVDAVKPGDRCAIEPYLNDPDSIPSRMGRSNCCPELMVIGVHCDGGLRQGAFRFPADKLHPGNELSFDQLALIEPLAIGSHAVHRAAPQGGETVLLIGAGPIGLACLEFLRLRDLDVIVMDLDEEKLRFCREHFGVEKTVLAGRGEATFDEVDAFTDARLADLVFDATGSAKSMSSCFEYSAHCGKVVWVGVGTEKLSFAHAPVIHRRELTILASRNALPNDFREIIGHIREGRIDVDPWITHRIPFDDVPREFAKVIDPAAGAIKGVIEVA